MIYRDVDRRIGYILSVSMVQSHPLIPVMENKFGDVPLHSDRIGSESYIDLFVQGDKAMRGKLCKANEPLRPKEPYFFRLKLTKMHGIVFCSEVLSTKLRYLS